MKEYEQDGWHVIEHLTMKPFEHFKADASKALMTGFGGLFTTHTWEGRTAHINSLTCDALLDYNNGTVKTRLLFKRSSAINAFPFLGEALRVKVLSDVRSLTMQVCDLYDTETREIFIAHGHDHEARHALKEFLRKLGLIPVVLIEQDDQGMTIVEKFEYFGSACSFAFILMTPDDKGGTLVSEEEQARARQNVILELGWFMARLGRKRVAILSKGKVEIPSDIQGVLCLEFKESILECADGILQRLRGLDLIKSSVASSGDEA